MRLHQNGTVSHPRPEDTAAARDVVWCEVCHRETPARLISILDDRALCNACANEWFDAQDEVLLNIDVRR